MTFCNFTGPTQMPQSEIALLQEYARTRDGIAFRELVDQHRDMVFAACHRVLGNQADAEDAAQNCFLKLAQSADMLRRRTVRRTAPWPQAGMQLRSLRLLC
jgi:sigma-70-like protein